MTAILGEIRAVPFNFAPTGWATCDGQLLAISQNTALFSLLGTIYGGNGQTNFALPDLRGATPIHFGQGPGLSGYDIGEVGGVEYVALEAPQLGKHRHAIRATSGQGDANGPHGAHYARPHGHGAAVSHAYKSGGGVAMAVSAIGQSGSGLPHNNLAPYLTLTFIIALQGVFPSRS